MNKRDRGANIRTEDGYRKLALESFGSVEMRVRTDLLRIPYSHLLIECRLIRRRGCWSMNWPARLADGPRATPCPDLYSLFSAGW